MASLIKQGASFYLQFFDTNRSPQRRKVPLKVTNKRAAKEIERRLLTAYASGKYDPWRDDPRTLREKDKAVPTLSEALSLFLSAKRDAGRSETTIRHYRENVERLRRSIGRDLTVDRVRADHLAAYVHADGIKRSSQRNYYRHVRAFFNWLADEGLVAPNPIAEVSSPPSGDRLPKTMYRDDLEAICNEVRDDYRAKRASEQCKQGEIVWRAHAFRFLYLTGLRGGELARLQWSHLDLDRGLIYILKQKNNRQQTIPLHRKAASVLDEVPDGLPDGSPDSYVFGGPGTRGGSRNIESFRNNLSRAFRGYREDAGIDRPITLHSLRHGFCTALAEAGKSAATIKELARHASISTSMIYVKMSNEHLKAEMEDVF